MSTTRRMHMTGGALIAKPWPLLQRCIEHGLERGWNRAHKHDDDPTSRAIWDSQQSAIELEIAEAFDIKDGGENG